MSLKPHNAINNIHHKSKWKLTVNSVSFLCADNEKCQ